MKPAEIQSQSESADVGAAAWLDQHGDYLFSYAVKCVRSVDLAEDLVQETLLAAIVAQGSFAGRSAVRSWLTGILKHKIADHRRRTKRHAVPSQTGTPVAASPSEANLAEWVDDQFTARGKWKAQPARWGGDPSAESERNELSKILAGCLDALPPRVAEVFLLVERTESSAQLSSNVLGVSTTNIAVILHRARMALRRCLEVNWFRRRGDRNT